MRTATLATVFAALLAWAFTAGAADLAHSLVLVAAPELKDPIYGGTVLVVKPFGRDQHLGFIVNRPTDLTLGRMFPDHAPSQKVPDPVFLGGPVDASALFALVAQADNPGGGSIEIMPGLFAAHDAAVVDAIIEQHPQDARFVAGLVVWRPGELKHEIDIGAWQLMDADPALAMRDPQGLWEELVQRSERPGNHNLLRTGG
jgi:putative transcriptional regulator